jgi:hypothetical protein
LAIDQEAKCSGIAADAAGNDDDDEDDDDDDDDDEPAPFNSARLRFHRESRQ